MLRDIISVPWPNKKFIGLGSEPPSARYGNPKGTLKEKKVGVASCFNVQIFFSR